MQERPKHWEEFYSDFRHFGCLRVTVNGVQYSAADIVSCKVERYLSDSGPSAGNACAACLTLRIIPREPVPRAACVRLYYQLRLNAAVTEFIRKGTFYVSKRRQDGRILMLECYDAMLKAEQEFLTEETTDDWPKSAAEVVTEIAARMGLSVDSRNMDLSGERYHVGLPAGLTMREVLQDIAARAGGNWCVSTLDTLRLVPVCGTGDVAPAVKGRPSVHPPMTIAGVRLWADGENYWAWPNPLPEGDILDAMATDATPDGAATLYSNVAGVVYRPYESEGRHIDPACELGDTVPIGGTEYLAWRMVEYFHQSYSVDLSAPAEDSEVEDEYPFLTQAERLNKRVSRLATTVSSISKGQSEIVLRVETVEQESQNLADASAEHSQQLATLSLSLDGFKTEVADTYATVDSLDDGLREAAEYAGNAAAQAKTEAEKTALEYAKTALETANRYTNDSLLEYSTTAEMNSAIEQSANGIRLEVAAAYATTVYVDSAMTSAVDEANSDTDGKLAAYSTTVQMNSAIEQSASGIRLEVSESYATKAYADSAASDALGEANSATDGKLEAYSTTVQMQSAIEQSAKKISLSVQNNGTSSVLTLSYDGTTLSSQNVEITGFVTFSSLSTSGQSTINGGNITTGTIGSAAGNTQYNLDEGWIRTGTASGAHVLINSTTIRWFIDANTPTGMFHSLEGRTYIGANSRYTMYGWLPNYAPSFYPSSGGPTSEFVGLYVDNVDGLIHCCANKFEIAGRIECASLRVNGRDI